MDDRIARESGIKLCNIKVTTIIFNVVTNSSIDRVITKSGIPIFHKYLSKFYPLYTLNHTMSNAVATIIRVILGPLLVILGLGGFGIVVTTIIAQMAALILLIITLRILGFTKPVIGEVRKIIKIGLANYPQTLATQLIVSSGAVLLAILLRIPEHVGTFYIILMITLALSTLLWDMTTLSLPVMVKTGRCMLTSETMKIGCALVLLAIISLVIMAKQVLLFINPYYTSGVIPLNVLLFYSDTIYNSKCWNIKVK